MPNGDPWGGFFYRLGGGGTLIFSYIRSLRRLGPFLGFKISNFTSYFFFFFFFWGGGGGVRKMNKFLFMKILWIFLGVITKLDLF